MTKSARLKINDADYEALKAAVLAVVEKNPKAYEQYRAQGLSDMRYNWDILRASGYPTTSLYGYLNDDHINSALADILENTGRSAKEEAKRSALVEDGNDNAPAAKPVSPRG